MTGEASLEEPGQLPDFASRVLDVADSIPPGRVMSYGDVAEYLGQGGPRQVGRVMALWGGSAAWWRVVHADGSLVPGHERTALEHYRAEGTPLRPCRRRAAVPGGHAPGALGWRGNVAGLEDGAGGGT